MVTRKLEVAVLEDETSRLHRSDVTGLNHIDDVSLIQVAHSSVSLSAGDRRLPGERACVATVSSLDPFGLLIESGLGEVSLLTLSVDVLRMLVRRHHLLVLRGFSDFTDQGFVAYCRAWGALLEWNFGALLNLVEHREPKNYLFTSGKVPMHWDGAFREVVPEFQVFRCIASDPECGGETLFTDAISPVVNASAEQSNRWRSVDITYKTEQMAHYGGCFTSPLVCVHPHSGKPVIRYGEPADEHTSKLNPFEVIFNGAGDQVAAIIKDELAELLYSSRYCYAHCWKPGDYLIADNWSLLHGRRAFGSNSGRHLQRVHVL